MIERGRGAVLLGCSILGLAVTIACDRDKISLKKQTTPVRISAIEQYEPGRSQPYSASILPNRSVNLSFRGNGVVASLHQVRGADGRMRSVDLGDIVQAGTVLGQLRSEDYQLQVSQADGQMKQARETEQTAGAQLQQAEASALKAEQDYERADALFKKTSLTKSDYDAARANRDATRAQVEAARTQLAASTGSVNAAEAVAGTANLGLHDSSLRAPFTGSIVQRSIEPGMLAGPSTVAFVLADTLQVKVTFGVPDIAVAKIKRGTQLQIYTEVYPSRRFQGFVSAVAPNADSSTRSFQIEVTVPNKESLLRPGMIASLDLGMAAVSKPVTVVPIDAIVRTPDDSSRFAVVVVKEGIAKRTPVALGATYGDRIAVSGVEPGTRVVSSGATFVSDGEPVTVIP